MRMVAVVLGGGVGQRLGAGMPKQLLTLGGQTLVERCVAAFDQAPGVDEVLVVMAHGYAEQVKAMLADGGYRKVTDVIEGGATRPDSTRVALGAITQAIAGDGEDEAIPLEGGKSLWTARVAARSKVRSGQPIELAVDTSNLQFFDHESGLAIGRGAQNGS